jgi:hypothetical protein
MTATLVPAAGTGRAFALDQIRIASPCSRQWGELTPVDSSGADRVRYCGDCRLNVYNLSNMTRAEAEAVIEAHEGRLCAGFYRRADGTVLTRDCPVGLRALRRKAFAAWARVAGAAALLVTTTLAMGARRGYWSPRLADLGPFATLREWAQPGWRRSAPIPLGRACAPPLPVPGPAPIGGA